MPEDESQEAKLRGKGRRRSGYVSVDAQAPHIGILEADLSSQVRRQQRAVERSARLEGLFASPEHKMKAFFPKSDFELFPREKPSRTPKYISPSEIKPPDIPSDRRSIRKTLADPKIKKS